MTKIVSPRWFNIMFVLTIGFLISDCTSLKPPPNEENWPSWAPDGQRLVYECYLDGPVNQAGRVIDRLNHPNAELTFYMPEAADLCICDVNGRNQVRLTEDPGGDWHPAWSPDNSQIAYLRADGIYLISPDGQNQRQLVSIDLALSKLSWRGTASATIKWSPEGSHLLFSGCLEFRDHDIYIVDASTGVMTNLTPDSRAEDFAPMWTLNGSRIVFLSTNLSSPHSCGPDENALPQIKAINADGSSEHIVYDSEFYYPPWQVSVANSGQILFVTDMTSKTASDYFDPYAEYTSLYRIELVEGTLTKVFTPVYESIHLPVWSPDEKYVAYRSSFYLNILDVETGAILEPRERLSIEPRFIWSPDSQKVAVTVSIRQDLAIDSEEHIHIFDIQSGTYHPLIRKHASLEDVE